MIMTVIEFIKNQQSTYMLIVEYDYLKSFTTDGSVLHPAGHDQV